MLNRRHFLASGLAASSLGLAAPALAHKKGEAYVLPDELMPREVLLKTKLPPGEVHVDPNRYTLYLTMEGNRAMRWSVGIGRGNLYHPGEFTVGAKREWPNWAPTQAMLDRNPNGYKIFREGGKYFESAQPGGISNPLGARAMYLYSASGKDTYLRIHGTNDPRTIGVDVSNGCARLINPQVEDLYALVPLGTRVVLYAKTNAPAPHSIIPNTAIVPSETS
jgi:lipoprotein-anchoring transpeptidase ErfK/SrfK